MCHHCNDQHLAPLNKSPQTTDNPLHLQLHKHTLSCLVLVASNIWIIALDIIVPDGVVGGGDGAVPAAAAHQPDPDPRQAEDEAMPVQPALPLLKLR